MLIPMLAVESQEDSRRLDALLVYPPWPAVAGRARLISTLPPLGVLSIAACIETAGRSVAVIDAHAEQLDIEGIAVRIRQHRPRFLGLSVLTSQCPSAHRVARLAKEIVPDCVVVAGGVHAEAMPERMLQNSAFDCVVRGDGEDTMLEIMEGKDFGDVLGLSYRVGVTVEHNAARPVETKLDARPMPAYHLVDFGNYYPGATTYRHLPAINLLMTRGCPGRCTFCNSAKTTLRSRSPESMVAQVKHLHDTYGIRQFQFYDDTFTVLKKVCLRFCELLEAEQLDVSWIAFIRGDCFSEELAAAMQRAGCHQVLIGIETGSAQIGARIGKTIDPQRYHRSVEIAHAHGMEVRASFVIGNLDETWETMQASLDLAIDLDVDFFQLFISTPYPGTAVFKEAVERGWLKHMDWIHYGQAMVLVDQPQISAEEIHRFEGYANRSFYLRPRSLKRMLGRVLNGRHLRDYALAVPYVLMGLNDDQSRGHWSCWRDLKEEDFFDISIEQPNDMRLTWEVRQEGVA